MITLLRIWTIIILVSNGYFGFAQDIQWKKADLGNSATIEFPEQATKKETKGQQVYVLDNGKALYIAFAQAEAFDINPDSVELNKFYDGVIRGTLESAGGGAVIKKSSFMVDGFIGMEIQFTTPNKPNLPEVKFLRSVLVNGTLYNQNFWTSAEQAQALSADRNRFFSSFKPGAKKSDSSEIESSSAYKSGKLMGTLAFYSALAVAAIAVVRRLRKPKQVS